MIIDTHAHYDDEVFDIDRDILINSFENNNIELAVNVAASLDGCHNTLSLIEQYANIYGSIGVHPSEIMELNSDELEWMKTVCRKNSINEGGKIVAVGEIGLDYHYDEPSSKDQKKWFEAQIEMAREVRLPMIIHSRDAAKDTMDIMKALHTEEIGGIIHCYSYSVEMAREFVDMGFYIGVGGVLTFKNAKKLVEVVEDISIDNIVLETDAPYLSPVPFRGERNDSSKIKYVVDKISEIKGIDAKEILRITNMNAKRVYRLENANIR